jgi:hypothetical protein
MQDFPAAHSMDMTWFAIDADGYVGIFDSDEGGAVPKDLTNIGKDRIDDRSQLLDLLLKDKQGVQDIKSVEIKAIFEDMSLMNLRRIIMSLEKMSKSHSHPCWLTVKHLILHLSNEESINSLKLQANTILRFVDRRIVVYVDKCDREWLKQAIKSQIALAGKEANLEYNISWLGWYEYNCGEQYPNPYYRKYPINTPVYFDNLAPEIRDFLRITELPNVRFAEIESIQPIEHMPCQTWGGSENWIDTNGVEHDRFPEYPNLDRAKD